LVLCTFARAEQSQQMMYSKGHLGMNALSIILARGGNSRNRIAFLGGVRTDYYPSNVLGIFVGGDFTSRGTELMSGETASASFTDWIGGLALRHSSLIFSESSKSFSHFGPYLSIPLGPLKAGSVEIQQSQISIGAYIDTELLFPIGDPWLLGLKIWAKAGLTDSFKQSELSQLRSIVETGLGICVSY
ncbi:MAG: hypothetical protein HY537_03295, partial [Deltaproteobacteria bacterium]|nr:hypothetical protein [Deltaproteobacteria bacterium]